MHDLARSGARLQDVIDLGHFQHDVRNALQQRPAPLRALHHLSAHFQIPVQRINTLICAPFCMFEALPTQLACMQSTPGQILQSRRILA